MLSRFVGTYKRIVSFKLLLVVFEIIVNFELPRASRRFSTIEIRAIAIHELLFRKRKELSGLDEMITLNGGGN